MNFRHLLGCDTIDVHQMTSQILLILTDFYPDICTIFNNFSNLLAFITLEREKVIRKGKLIF